jgi:hypothetical protein
MAPTITAGAKCKSVLDNYFDIVASSIALYRANIVVDAVNTPANVTLGIPKYNIAIATDNAITIADTRDQTFVVFVYLVNTSVNSVAARPDIAVAIWLTPPRNSSIDGLVD